MDAAAVVIRQEEISIPKSKRRSIEISGENVRKRVAVNSKAEPPSFIEAQACPALSDAKLLCEEQILLWKYVRYLSASKLI